MVKTPKQVAERSSLNALVPSANETIKVNVDKAPEVKTNITTDATAAESPEHLPEHTFYESTNTHEDDEATTATDCSHAIPGLEKTIRNGSPGCCAYCVSAKNCSYKFGDSHPRNTAVFGACD
uniref:Uncharacterized protein n=1 Tax=Parascaris univalens TaxID=6257 RepID=A0A915A069_PARUN